jgi:hypothetical protein
MRNPDSYDETLFGSLFPRNLPGGMRAIGFTPRIAGRVQKYELAVSRNSSGSRLNGWLCRSVSNQPGPVMEKVSFVVPERGTNLLLSANSSIHPKLATGETYWFVLAPQNAGREDYGWYRNESAPGGSLTAASSMGPGSNTKRAILPR